MKLTKDMVFKITLYARGIFLMVLVFLALSALYAEVYDGPFGLKKGLTLAQLKLIDPDMERSDIYDYTYAMSVVPLPNRDFISFRVVVAPDSGLCKIVAVSAQISTSCFGTELKSKYCNLRDVLESKYGQYYEIDELMRGSIWYEAEDFMMAILKKERMLKCVWHSDSGSVLTNNIQSISLDGNAVSTDTGCLILIYEFDNFGYVKSQIDKKQERSF